jgi:hypothetical protein
MSSSFGLLADALISFTDRDRDITAPLLVPTGPATQPLVSLRRGFFLTSQTFLFLTDRLYISIKKPHSVLLSWILHVSPRELTVANSRVLWCQREMVPSLVNQDNLSARRQGSQLLPGTAMRRRMG